MHLRIRVFVVAAALALATAGARAQDVGPIGQPPQGGRGGRMGGAGGPQPPDGIGGRGGRFGGPLRDNVEAPKGTGKIIGRVVSADTGNPIRRAQVRVNAPEARVNRLVTTDNNGRY